MVKVTLEDGIQMQHTYERPTRRSEKTRPTTLNMKRALPIPNNLKSVLFDYNRNIGIIPEVDGAYCLRERLQYTKDCGLLTIMEKCPPE